MAAEVNQAIRGARVLQDSLYFRFKLLYFSDEYLTWKTLLYSFICLSATVNTSRDKDIFKDICIRSVETIYSFV